jgi:hypothetical protein
MSSTLPSSALCPGLMVPPYTMMEGRLSRAIAMTLPGMFLSQPGSDTLASYHWRVGCGGCVRVVCVRVGGGVVECITDDVRRWPSPAQTHTP